MPSEPQKVFISYNRADRDWAEWMAGVIKGAGYEPILDVWHFRPGENFVLRMQQAATQANLTLAVLSEAYLQASYTQPEWAAAFAQDPTGEDRRLIPVRVGKCALPGMLRSIIYIDLINLREEEAERALLNGLKPSGEPARPPRFPANRVALGVSGAPFPPDLARLYKERSGEPRRFDIGMFVDNEIIGSFINRSFLDPDDDRVLDEMLIHEIGGGLGLSDLINREQLRETLRKKQQDVSSVVSTTDLPVQPQARRVQSRKRLSQRTNSVVARILKDLGLAPNGREVGKRNKKVAGRDNRAAVSDLLNKAINEHLGIASGGRKNPDSECLR